MPPLITREEALELGRITDHAEIEALVERAWEARQERFGDSTDMCSLVNAKSGGCAEDCGFCAQSQYAEAETPMHAMMEPEQILEHARAAEAAGAHRFCMVTQGQGLSKRDFEKVLEGARLVAEHTNLKRCASIGHMSRRRARKALKEAGIQRVHHNVETAESYYPEVSTTVRYEGRLRTIDAVERGRPGDLRRRHPQPRRDRASSASRWPSSSPTIDPTSVPINLLNPRPGTKFGDRDLMDPWEVVKWIAIFRLDPPGRAVPPLRRPRREPRRAAAAGGQGRAQRRDDGQLPDHARQRRPRRTARCSRSSASTSPRQPDNGANPRPDNRSGWLDGETPGRRRRAARAEPDAPLRTAALEVRLWDPSDAAALRSASARCRRGPDGAPNSRARRAPPGG